MEAIDWAWVFEHGDDSEYREEQAEFDRWQESGKSVEEWLGQTPNPTKAPPPVPKLAVSRETAADMLSISVDHFDRHVKPELRLIQRGARLMIPVSELERWLAESAARALR